MRALTQALLFLVALASFCQADSPSFSDQKPKWVDMEELFKNRRVLAELKLTGNQAVQGQLASLEPLAKHTAEVNKLQGLKPEEFQARLQKLMEIYNGRQREAVGKVLTRDQYKRIKQIQGKPSMPGSWRSASRRCRITGQPATSSCSTSAGRVSDGRPTGPSQRTGSRRSHGAGLTV